ncbi:MAG: cell filamentation protein Fic [Flavobacteriales bacterium CG_4_10_14_0_2_um_filter_32_8]|nr:MAG: cell filamentation protein Fic [Flavobacteriales bacterium CG_4_10_14_0_2_um_filter_32_8]PJB15970.1 MAG: cell filamentation protein Fic [Flavobacteriales bacterium CG_4_9_14_3_um_filter_32_8]
MLTNDENKIISVITSNPSQSSKDILKALKAKDKGIMSYATLKRRLSKLVSNNLISIVGRGRGTTYVVSQEFQLLNPFDVEEYFAQDVDKRKAKKGFNFDLITHVLNGAKFFTKEELEILNELQEEYTENINKLSETENRKALEHLSIDLTWKSSEIEGNTYTLLETEALLKNKETAKGKTMEEANMLLNHKEAIDFLIQENTYLEPLSVAKIENIHSLLVQNLKVDRNIRKGIVTVTGTIYKPLDNEHQIREALQDMCNLINNRKNIFEKALLALVLISYIQAFGDGNKRTARIISNGILIQNKFCPISFLTIDSVEYKKAMLFFYEQNNISAFKRIFIDQLEYAAITYFS